MAVKYKAIAAVLEEFGGPFSVGEVELEAPDSWVLVEPRSVGVCGRDLVVWRGGFRNLRPPLVLGHEVYGLYRGKPVGVYPALPGSEPRVLGEHAPGGYSSLVAVPEENLVGLPDGETEKYAAAVCGVATMMHAARVAGLSAGDRVLVTGAGGGVGIHGVQYLLLLGAEVYGYARSPEKRKALESLGAKPVKDLGLHEEASRVDAVIEIVGAPTINHSMRALRPGGTLVLVGNVEGEPVTVERPALLVMREIRVVGSAAYTMREFESAVKLVGRGEIKPFYKTYRLEEINKAYKDIAGSRIVGRAVLIISA